MLAENGKLYNTTLVYGRSGEQLCSYSKLHMFDIDIPGGVKYKESDTFSPGDTFGIFETDFGKVGLAICYDIRFAEVPLILRAKGARILIAPSNFNQTTGPLHWELMLRARAHDIQTYVLGCSASRYTEDPSVY